METNDITVEILKDIRQELRNVRGDLSSRIDSTNSELGKLRIDLSTRIDQTNADLGSLRSAMIQRLTESEVRTATELTDVVGAIHEVRDLLRSQSDLRPRVEKCESDIADINRRLP